VRDPSEPLSRGAVQDFAPSLGTHVTLLLAHTLTAGHQE
jgi:hypothetical protein